MKDYYYLLGLNNNASLEEIKSSYRKLSKKFHPDVNDGDLFFTERFKDIQEAYEVLSNLDRRRIYDLKYSSKSESSRNNSNLNPEIRFFESNKKVIHIGDEITFRWETINADVVILEPLGPVNSAGEITYRITNSKVNKIPFKLVAINSNIDVKAEREIIVSNITFETIKKIVHQDPIIDKKFTASYIKQESYFKPNIYYNAFMNIIDLIWSKLSVPVAFMLSVGLAMYIIYIFFKLFMDFKKE